MSDDWWSDDKPARPVKGGVQARSKRGAMGSAWWSRRFSEAVESLAPGPRMRQGRAYARKGQVASLEVRPGRVSATVQGSAQDPYDVTIDVSMFDDGTWLEVGEALRAQPLLAARLLAGELPEETEAIFAAAEADLFPARMSDLKMACTCPDWSSPCKHVAAVFTLLAEHLDTDPFLLLALRGGTRERVAGLLGEPMGPSAGENAAAQAPAPLPTDAAAFWAAGPVPPPLTLGATPVDLPLVRRLGPFPFWRGPSPLFELLRR